MLKLIPNIEEQGKVLLTTTVVSTVLVMHVISKKRLYDCFKTSIHDRLDHTCYKPEITKMSRPGKKNERDNSDELFKKLARRKALNGEGESTSSNPSREQSTCILPELEQTSSSKVQLLHALLWSTWNKPRVG